MQRRIEMITSTKDDGVELRSPEVGRFTCALDRGSLVAPGAICGMITTLGETVVLVVPRGVSGRVVSEKPERVHAPVGYGDVLYELVRMGAGDASDVTLAATTTTEDGGALVFRSEHRQ